MKTYAELYTENEKATRQMGVPMVQRDIASDVNVILHDAMAAAEGDLASGHALTKRALDDAFRKHVLRQLNDPQITPGVVEWFAARGIAPEDPRAAFGEAYIRSL